MLTCAAAFVCLCLPAAATHQQQQVRIVDHAFDIVHLLTDQNPVQVLVDAIING